MIVVKPFLNHVYIQSKLYFFFFTVIYNSRNLIIASFKSKVKTLYIFVQPLGREGPEYLSHVILSWVLKLQFKTKLFPKSKYIKY